MEYDWLTILIAIIGIVVAWKILKGLIKAAVMIAIVIAAAYFVTGGFA